MKIVVVSRSLAMPQRPDGLSIADSRGHRVFTAPIAAEFH